MRPKRPWFYSPGTKGRPPRRLWETWREWNPRQRRSWGAWREWNPGQWIGAVVAIILVFIGLLTVGYIALFAVAFASWGSNK